MLQISTVKKLSGLRTTVCDTFVIKYKSKAYILDVFIPYWAHSETQHSGILYPSDFCVWCMFFMILLKLQFEVLQLHKDAVSGHISLLHR